MGRYTPKKFDLGDFKPDNFSVDQSLPEIEDPYQPTAEDKRQKHDAGMWDFIGDIAPVAGGVIGGGLGLLGGPAAAATVPIGAAIGSGLGNLAGGFAHNTANNDRSGAEDRASATDARRAQEENRRLEAEQKRQDAEERRRDMMNLLMGLR